MSDLLQQIQINDLLIERDSLFVQIHELEQQARQLVGPDYPFPRGSLPSDVKAKKKKASKSQATTKAPKLEKLKEGEMAYQIAYTDKDELHIETHTNHMAIKRFVQLPSNCITIDAIEIIKQRP